MARTVVFNITVMTPKEIRAGSPVGLQLGLYDWFLHTRMPAEAVSCVW